jgi:hypothetical protein
MKATPRWSDEVGGSGVAGIRPTFRRKSTMTHLPRISALTLGALIVLGAPARADEPAKVQAKVQVSSAARVAQASDRRALQRALAPVRRAVAPVRPAPVIAAPYRFASLLFLGVGY